MDLVAPGILQDDSKRHEMGFLAHVLVVLVRL